MATAVFIPSPCSDKTRQPTAYDTDEQWRVLTRRSALAGAAAREASGIACESPDNFSFQGKSHPLSRTKNSRCSACTQSPSRPSSKRQQL
jgi:hypothetical protein